MSDTDQPHEPQNIEPSAGGTASEAKGSSLRLKILLLFLGLLLIAFWYDYSVARVGVETAYDKIETLNSNFNRSQTGLMSNLDVQEALGRTPNETYEDGPNTVEVYRWRSGLPFKSHEYLAVYAKGISGLTFKTHFKYAMDNEPPELPALAEGEVLTDDIGDASPRGNPEAEGGEGGRRGGFDPVAMFEQRDADKDGKLTGDEIPERMQERLEAIDTDGDGSITLEEMQAGRRRRGEGRGEGRGDGRPQRPTGDATDGEGNDANEAAGNDEPETTAPETTAPETSEPETSEPETSEPEPSEPKLSEPEN